MDEGKSMNVFLSLVRLAKAIVMVAFYWIKENFDGDRADARQNKRMED